jgi:hypothetical protein
MSMTIQRRCIATVLAAVVIGTQLAGGGTAAAAMRDVRDLPCMPTCPDAVRPNHGEDTLAAPNAGGSAGFQWADAGIGVGVGIALGIGVFGAGIAAHRRGRLAV